MNVAVIPARGGSKRIPRKNIRAFCGRPMIGWSIAALQRSACIDRIVVSTDDDEVAAIARGCGAEVPFRRPAELADDQAATLPVLAHALRELCGAGAAPRWLCCVYATAPLLDPDDLAAGLRLIEACGADYVFSCTTFAFPIQRALRRDATGGVEPMFAEAIGQRSQDLPEAFHDAGQFYWGTPDAFGQQRPIFGPRSRPLMIPRHRVQDIDTEEDWDRAELLFRAFKDRKP